MKNLSELSSDEKDRLLAEHFEPKPDFDPRELHSSEWAVKDIHFAAPNTFNGVQSSIKMWRWFRNHSWQPRSFLEPELTIFLQKELLVHHDLKLERGGIPEYSIVIFNGLAWTQIEQEVFEDTVRDAALLAFGLAQQ